MTTSRPPVPNVVESSHAVIYILPAPGGKWAMEVFPKRGSGALLDGGDAPILITGKDPREMLTLAHMAVGLTRPQAVVETRHTLWPYGGFPEHPEQAVCTPEGPGVVAAVVVGATFTVIIIAAYLISHYFVS